MAAECGGAATHYGAQHFDMQPVQPALALLDEGHSDIRDSAI